VGLLQFTTAILLALLLGGLAVTVLRRRRLPGRSGRRGLFSRCPEPPVAPAPTVSRGLSVVVTEPGQHQVRFASVGGAAAAKAALLRLCARLRQSDPEISDIRSGSHRSAQSAIGGVLHGPPGCGKTLLARALAGELNLPLYTLSGAELTELAPAAFAAPLRELFATAALRAPSLIFIDSLDALNSRAARPAAASGAGCDSGAPVVLQLVSLLDELSREQAGVVVLGAARRLEGVDEALVRPERLGRAVALALPELRERAEIIALLGRAHPELDNLDVLALATRTQGYSGADLGRLLGRLARLVSERPQPGGPTSIETVELERAIADSPPPTGSPKAS